MRAVMVVPGETGGHVEIRDVAVPEPAAGEVRVAVRAASINRGEIVARRGMKTGAPQASGIEFAGSIDKLGPGVERWKVGDRVMGHWRAGQAEYATVDQRLIMPVPERLSWVEAAAWPYVFITAHDAMVSNGGLKKGESVLINAVSSGIGVAALQIARLIGAKPVIGSSRSPGKLEALKRHGLEVSVGATGFATDVMNATGNKGADVVIDCVGANVLGELMQCMALKGRLVGVGRLAATRGEIDMDLLALRRLQLIGVTFRTRTLDERVACVATAAADLLPALERGEIGPVVERTFPLSRISEAHDFMERDAHTGKIVLEID